MLPHLVRYIRSNPASPVSSEDKKFGHIPNGLIVRNILSSPNENQPYKFSIHPDKKRTPVRVTPIKRKVSVAKSAIRPHLTVVELAEIVNIQLKQVSEDWLMIAFGGDQLNLREWLICMQNLLRCMLFPFGHAPFLCVQSLS
jgi:hypothetical protein